jgi:hypothetical protein
MPRAMFIGRICDEFRCLPSDAERELARQPVGYLEEIIEARNYTRAKQAYDDAHANHRRPPDHPLVQLVTAIEFQLAQEEIASQP